MIGVKLKEVLIFLFITGCITLNAQKVSKPIFFGINPSVTVEPFYESGELDVNILPLVFQRPISQRMDLRLTSLCNLGIRNDGNGISHFGLETALPIFLHSRQTEGQFSEGFYAAPVVSFSRNRMEAHNNLGLWIEPGYSFLFENNFALTLGLQFGGTYFNYDSGSDKWGSHFGVKVIFGKWW